MQYDGKFLIKEEGKDVLKITEMMLLDRKKSAERNRGRVDIEKIPEDHDRILN